MIVMQASEKPSQEQTRKPRRFPPGGRAVMHSDMARRVGFGVKRRPRLSILAAHL